MNESRTAPQPLQLYRFPNRERAAAAAPSDHDCVVALKALAEETRVRIISLLIDAPLDVTELAGRVGISQYNASKHLRVLREAGLLRLEKSGRRHLYALTEGIGRRMAEGGVLDLGCCSFQFEGETSSAKPRANGRRRRTARR
jgi:DNA-binding transcriptional ArsR family regulator